jgi:hypothetical protein
MGMEVRCSLIVILIAPVRLLQLEESVPLDGVRRCAWPRGLKDGAVVLTRLLEGRQAPATVNSNTTFGASYR